LTIIAVLVAVIVGFRLAEEIGPERSPSDRFVVTGIVDGDTMELGGKDLLRLLAIDTPEEGEAFHEEATELLRSLTIGKSLRVEFVGRRRDRYGRLLGFAYVDSLFINREILDSGLGYLYLFQDNELQRPEIGQLLEAQRGALSKKIGVWSVERMPEEYYINKAGSFRFHRPACQAVQDLEPGRYQMFETREEALRQGLSPCRNCKP
jgi:endonuclease YncB( thermonuclease family)